MLHPLTSSAQTRLTSAQAPRASASGAFSRTPCCSSAPLGLWRGSSSAPGDPRASERRGKRRGPFGGKRPGIDVYDSLLIGVFLSWLQKELVPSPFSGFLNMAPFLGFLDMALKGIGPFAYDLLKGNPPLKQIEGASISGLPLKPCPSILFFW